MTKMKRSELKIIVKECVRECLREIMQEQINPGALREMFGPAAGAVINPMDADQMLLRQDALARRGSIQGQLRNQVSQNALVPASQSRSTASPEMEHRRYNSESGTGYINPSDRLKQAAQTRQVFDPTLDSNPYGHLRQQGQPTAKTLRLDPELDRSITGGDIRPPDPNLLREIYEDTARSTYVLQQENQAAPANRFAATVAENNPEDLFPGAQNWATLAFPK